MVIYILRKLLGTELKNSVTGKTIYTPPQDEKEILNYWKNLFVINQNILISILISAEKEFLKKKNFDVDFLFQVLQAIYNSNYDFENKANNIKRKNICWQIITFDI